jgi:hypothetical protein
MLRFGSEFAGRSDVLESLPGGENVTLGDHKSPNIMAIAMSCISVHIISAGGLVSRVMA